MPDCRRKNLGQAGSIISDVHSSCANNFDLVRFLAASQVVVGHICAGATPEAGESLLRATWWLGYFPGVPIFFTVSGFFDFLVL